MRQTQSESQSSWSHYAKAAAVFTLTTATYLVARTTGWLPSWFSDKKLREDINTAVIISSTETSLTSVVSQSSGVAALQHLELTDLSITEENSEKIQVLSTQRRLLQQPNQVTVINPILDQPIESRQLYNYSLNNIFSGNYSLLGAVEKGKTSLPDWLSLQYTLVGSYPADSYAYDVEVSGSTVFVADWNSLLILNVSTPETPRLLGRYSTPSSLVYCVAISGNTLFVGDYDAGLLILDVNTPNTPRLLGNYTGSGNPYDIKVSGNMVFVADRYAGLLILDVSTPSIPRLLGSYPAGSGAAQGVAVSGSTVFVANDNALLILDVSTLSTPHLLSSYPVGPSGSAQAVVVSGSTVFVANGAAGLLILNVSTPSAPSFMGSYPAVSGNVVSMEVFGNTVFMIDDIAGLLILDVTTPSAPRLLGSHPGGSGGALGVAVSGSTLFVVDFYSGLMILNMSQGLLIGVPPNLRQEIVVMVSARNFMTALVETGFILTLDQFPHLPQITISDQSIFPGHDLSLTLNSNRLFVSMGNPFLGLSIQTNGGTGAGVPIWFTLTCSPLALGSYPAGSRTFSNVAVSGSTAFVADDDRFPYPLLILNVSTPSSARLLNSYDAGYISDIVVYGSTLFVAAQDLLILDVSIPSVPQLLGSYSGFYIYKLVVSGSIVYAAAWTDGLVILNVSNLSTPILLSNYSSSSGQASSVAVSGSMLYVGDQMLGLLLLDVSAPSAPRLLGKYTDNVYGVAVSGDTVFVEAYSEILILDVSTPSVPRWLGSYPRDLGTTRFVVLGSTLFLADRSSGLQILDVSTLSIPVLLGSFPAGSAGSAQSVAVSGDILVMADWSAGLLILDVSRWILTAAPTMADVGNYNLKLTATDALSGTGSILFTIRVEGPPQLNGSIPLQRAWAGQPFNYFVPPDLFFDPNDDVIGYSAGLVGGKKLPTWLQFNPRIAGFGGVAQASDAGNYTIVLSATDHICPETPTINFTVSVGFLPVLSHRISNQLAPIGLTYKFIVTTNSFYDPEGLALSYLAQGVNNQPLPSWLQFNSSSLLFFGVANTSNITVYTLQLIATNSAGGQVIASFTLRTDHFPAFNKILSLPIASVNQPWVWALPSDAFTDADDGDPLTYTATQEDGSVLPSWLSFNPITRTFKGVPLFTGTQGLKITAQDSYGGINSTYFNTTILSASLSGSEIVPPSARAGKSFAFQVNASSILGNDKTFNYSASLTDGASLPSWLQFTANNLSFTGLPTSSDVGSYDIALIATDSQGIQYNVSFALNVNPNYPPQVYLPISNQVAQVNEPFVFYVPKQTFVDPNGDNLTYTVHTLLSWLSFDPQQLKFWGTPARSDTDPLTAHVNNIELTAHDDESQTSALFTISVQGTSNLLLFLQVGIPLLTGLTSLYKAYQNRALLLNRCCRNRIVKHEVIATTGEEFHVDLKTEPKEVGKIQVKLPKPSPLLDPAIKLVPDSDPVSRDDASPCCSRLFRPCQRVMAESPDHLPPAYPLPTWLKYSDRNRLFSTGSVPQVKRSQFTVQVLNRANVIREELNVTVQAARV